jgi:hypothetical protein
LEINSTRRVFRQAWQKLPGEIRLYEAAVSLQAGKFLSAHAGEILTFPFVHKGAGLFHEPVFFRTPESLFEGFVAPLFC